MARNRTEKYLFTPAQTAALISWVSEGNRREEIQARAAAFDPPFIVTSDQISRVRQKAGKKFTETRDAWEREAFEEGLARKAVRINRLSELAERLEQDLFGSRLWVEEPKQCGTQTIDVERFNASEVKEYRGILDDIAKELGHRVSKIEHSGKIDVSKLSDEELERIARGEGAGGD